MKFFIVCLLLSMPSMAEEFPTGTIQVGSKKLRVEFAHQDKLRQKGLMYRTKLAKNHGMLFVFEEQKTLKFWMKNTIIPLSIGFFNKKYQLIDIQNMRPVKSIMDKKVPQYQSLKPAKYALEVNRGWFKKNDIKVGQKLKLLTPVPKARLKLKK